MLGGIPEPLGLTIIVIYDHPLRVGPAPEHKLLDTRRVAVEAEKELVQRKVLAV